MPSSEEGNWELGELTDVSLRRSEHIRPLNQLYEGKADFVQILLTQFTLTTGAVGSTLDVSFDPTTLAVFSVAGKDALRGLMRGVRNRTAAHQEKIDACLAGSARELHYWEEDFPFRYASGGVLPIVRLGERDYYVLFFRDIFPVGWNIANGGAESTEELLDPQRIVDREFREELLIAAPGKRRWYAFPDSPGSARIRAREVARAVWWERMGAPSDGEPEELDLSLKWVQGPDTVCVRYQGKEQGCSSGYFLNINAEDFGIEVDRIARMRLEEGAAFFDGEIKGHDLVNRPVGLFDVQRTNDVVRSESTVFRPERIFFSGEGHDGKELDRVVEDDFLPHIAPHRSRAQKRHFESQGNRLNLCPVTRQIISRYLSWEEHEPAPTLPAEVPHGARRPYDVFLSFKYEDTALAKLVYDYLSYRKLNVFFAPERRPEEGVAFSTAIDNALDDAKALVVVGTCAEHLRARWVHFEYNSYHIDMMNERKPADSLMSFVDGPSPTELPRPLKDYDVVPFPDFDRLYGYLAGVLKRSGSG